MTPTTAAIDRARALQAEGMPPDDIALRVPLTPYMLDLALRHEEIQATIKEEGMVQQKESFRQSLKLRQKRGE